MTETRRLVGERLPMVLVDLTMEYFNAANMDDPEACGVAGNYEHCEELIRRSGSVREVARGVGRGGHVLMVKMIKRLERANCEQTETGASLACVELFDGACRAGNVDIAKLIALDHPDVCTTDQMVAVCALGNAPLMAIIRQTLRSQGVSTHVAEVRGACRGGHAATFARLVADSGDLGAGNAGALQGAFVSVGMWTHEDMADGIGGAIDARGPGFIDQDTFAMACLGGSLEIVQWFMPLPCDDDRLGRILLRRDEYRGLSNAICRACTAVAAAGHRAVFDHIMACRPGMLSAANIFVLAAGAGWLDMVIATMNTVACATCGPTCLHNTRIIIMGIEAGRRHVDVVEHLLTLDGAGGAIHALNIQSADNPDDVNTIDHILINSHADVLRLLISRGLQITPTAVEKAITGSTWIIGRPSGATVRLILASIQLTDHERLDLFTKACFNHHLDAAIAILDIVPPTDLDAARYFALTNYPDHPALTRHPALYQGGHPPHPPPDRACVG